MTIDLSSIVWLFFALMLLQPIPTTRWCAVQRARTIRAIEKMHGSRSCGASALNDRRMFPPWRSPSRNVIRALSVMA